jgi:outer membrane autotransporter protein
MKTNATTERRDGQNLRHQSAMGLLLLTLLMANPLQGFGQSGVISANFTTGVNLTNLFGSPTNFVTVNSGVTINNSTSGSNAVFGNTYFWNLTNAATLNGNTNGIYMNAGGSVNNLTNGVITGGRYGVYITGGTNSVVSVVNAGSIAGVINDGVYMGTNGSVNNLTGGIITGGWNGVEIAGGGSVNNLTNGTITGHANGVVIHGITGSVVNAGSIIGMNSTGVFLGAGGSVNNLTNGTITGGSIGVYIDGATGSVVNAGSIAGNTGDGVYMLQGGSVNNLTNGTITGGNIGVYINGATGSVVNAGSIIGTNDVGVFLGASGSVNNLTNGVITGVFSGVAIGGATGSVVNDGSITASGGDGVDIIASSGSVSNLSGGIISGNVAGVAIVGDGSVNNLSGGIISGNGYGVGITSGIGSVVNAGSIVGTNNDGVGLANGGSVTNLSGGHITGGGSGVSIYGGTGSVVNTGSIIGQTYDGVYMDANGSVNNLTGGTITGGAHVDANGVTIHGTGSVVNAGSITSTSANGVGVGLGAGGSVSNLSGGIISGNVAGVAIVGGAGTLISAGTIIGTNGDGVYMNAGGSVYNQQFGTIQGGQYGVEITNGVASVTNAGLIRGSGGTAISLGNYSNTVTLETGSVVQGNIVGGTNTDAAFLQGHGSYSSNFLNFETLTVQADATGWNLTGTNTFSTNTTVQTGLLRINGSLTTPLLTVNTNNLGTNGLGGTGTITGIVDNHGYFDPGSNSIGTLTILGSMTNWGNYYVDVDASSNSDRIVMDIGKTTITNGAVTVQPAHQVYGTNTVYTILTATNGVTGTYSGGSSIAPTWGTFPSWLGFASSLQYTGTNVTLDMTRNPFVSVANTHNQYSVAGALDGVGVAGLSGTMSNLVTQFFWLPSAAAAQAALDSLSGEIHGTLGMLDVQQQDAFNHSVSLRTGRISAGGENSGYASAQPIQLASAGPTPLPKQTDASQLLDNIWLQGFGSFGHLDGDGNALGGDFTISGLNGGFDYRLSPEMLIGLAVGYSHDSASVGGPGASGDVDAIQFAGYGGYVSGPWHLDGILSYGFLQTDTKRFINVGSIHQEADGSYNGGAFSLSTEGGYAFKAGPVTIEPTLGLNYTHVSQDSFNEIGTASDGNNYGLNVRSVDMDSFRTALGVRLAAQFGKKDGVQFMPEVRAGWEHEFLDKTPDVNARFVGGSGDFNVRGVELGTDSGVLGAGLTVAFNKTIQGFVNYDANLNSRMSSHAISGGLSYSW